MDEKEQAEQFVKESAEERVHHPYSPSTLTSIEVCASYLPQQSAKPHARTVAGTMAHGVVESGVDDPRLSDEDAIAAAECLDFVDQRRQLMIQAAGPDAAKIIELKEEYFPVDDLVFPDGVKSTTAGYSDEAFVNHTGEYGEILDHKFGLWKVEAAELNPQGIAYALGLFFRFPKLQTIRVWFLQPLLNHRSDAVFTRAQVPELYLRVRAIVERARIARQTGSFEKANPTTPNCLFCANVGKCPPLLAMALKIAKKYHPLVFPESLTPSGMLAPEQAALALQLAGVLKVWSEAFRSAIYNRVITGEAPVPHGYKIQVSSSRREITDPEAYRNAALQYLTEEEYVKTLTPSLGSVEELISEKAPRGSKTTTVKEFGARLEESGAVTRGQPFSFLKASGKDE